MYSVFLSRTQTQYLPSAQSQDSGHHLARQYFKHEHLGTGGNTKHINFTFPNMHTLARMDMQGIC